MKKHLIVLFSAFLVCAFALPSLYAVEAPKGDMMIAVPAGEKATKAPVKFGHEGHKALECTACHHTWDGKGEVKSCAAEGCHTDLKDKKAKTSFYQAFHANAPQSCLGCHKAVKKEGKKTGPVACNDCHPKE